MPIWVYDFLIISGGFILLISQVKKILKRYKKEKKRQVKKARKKQKRELMEKAENGVSSLANELGIPLESDDEDE